MDRNYGSFIWDSHKERYNVKKHGIDFTLAARAFLDPQRKIVADSLHGKGEERYFCIGKAGRRIVTVRFVFRHKKIRIYGAGYWRKGAKYYEKANKKK